MKVFNGKTIKSGFLDYTLIEGEVRILTEDTWIIKKIEDQYIIPKRSLRLIFNYIRKVGFTQVIRKIRSRLKEKNRNNKYVILGRGVIVESLSTKYKKEDNVWFIGYNHPQWADNYTIYEDFVLHNNESQVSSSLKDIAIIRKYDGLEKNSLVTEIEGWSTFSGIKIIQSKILELFTLCFKNIDKTSETYSFKRGKFNLKVKSSNSKIKPKISSQYITAILFGLGQYAKTMILPNLDHKIYLCEICEIDPTQLGEIKSNEIIYSTNPYYSNNIYDVYIIAGYHHTHATLAHYALTKDKYVIIEKPIATTLEQYKLLKPFFKSGKIFVGFHKRYYTFNKYIYQDLNIQLGEAVSYYCIVYEINLPKKHWYNWPNSKSRIVSNGCHWIDHFMFLNSYKKVTRYDLILSSNKDYFIFLELENKAVFHLTLTDKGSPRIGVREHIELRNNSNHIRITDSYYIAENQNKILRKFKFNLHESQKYMYKEISKKISMNEKGDSLDSFESSRLTLILEELYKERVNI